MSTEIPYPEIVSANQWLAQRLTLLAHEKEATRQHDRVNAERRRLPMVKVEKEYSFDGPSGKVTLAELFENKHQLIVYHFMFAPEWDKGCPGCTGYIDEIADLSTLGERDTRFVLVSRAPLAKLEAYKTDKGWKLPWYSSLGSDFNYDFHVTLDQDVAPVVYNYESLEEMQRKYNRDRSKTGEMPGTSVFFRLGDDIFHTYSTFSRGGQFLTNTYSLLDITPYGRQEEWEDSPAGWPQKPTYG